PPVSPAGSTLSPYTTLFRSEPENEVGCGIRPRTQVGGTDDRLDGVGKDGRLVPAAGQLFPMAQADVLPQADSAGHLRESDGRHQDRKSTRLNSSHVKISYAV